MSSILSVKQGFNRISSIYDQLKWIVFGNILNKAEVRFLFAIKNHSTILVMGGGTGYIIEHLIRLKIPTIYYLELSDKMILKAQARVNNIEDNYSKIIFINSSWEEYLPDHQFDLIITNFFLDLFNEKTIREILKYYYKFLIPKAHWYCTDFYIDQSSGYFSKAIIKLMYLFFRITCKIEAKKLPDIFGCFDKELFELKLTEKSQYTRQSIFVKK